MKALKIFLQILQTISPKLAVRQVDKLMSTPRIRKLRENEEKVLDTAKTSVVKFKQFDIQQYEWGLQNDRRAILIHGWEGQAGNFAALVEPLLAMGFRILAFDAPGHGRSSKGKTDLFEFVDFLAAEIRQFQAEIVISHSFGSVQTSQIFRNNQDLSVPKWFAITTPFRYRDRIEQMSAFFGLSDKVLAKLIQNIETQIGEPIDHFSMDYYADTLRNVEDILIVHSKTDRIIPIEAARKTHQALAQSKMIELDGMGHYAILWSKEVRNILQDYLSPVPVKTS